VSSVSTSHSKAVYDALKACGVRIVSALPETWLVHLSMMGGMLNYYYRAA
jgi:sulfopyruvate decarboxylase subunit alpha